MKPTRKQTELVIAASLVMSLARRRDKFLAEITDLAPESFSIEKYRDVFTAFQDGTLNKGTISKADLIEYETMWTHAGHIRWYCLKLLDAAKGAK